MNDWGTFLYDVPDTLPTYKGQLEAYQAFIWYGGDRTPEV